MDRCTPKAMFSIRKSTERFIEELILFVFEQPEFTSRTKHILQKAKLNRLNYELALLHRDVTVFPWNQLLYKQYLGEDTKQVLLMALRDFRRRVTMCFIDILKIEGDFRTAKRAKTYYRAVFQLEGGKKKTQADDVKTNRLGIAKSKLAGILRHDFKRQFSKVSGPDSPLSDTAEVLEEKDEWCQSSFSKDRDNFKRQLSDVSGLHFTLSDPVKVLGEKDECCQSSFSEDRDNFKRQLSNVSGPHSALSDTAEILEEKNDGVRAPLAVTDI